MALFTEAWLPYIIPNKDNFFDNERFLSHGRNMNAFVENDKIHIAYKGGRPTITKNFKTDGTTILTSFLRTDIADEITLADYSTQVMHMPADELMRLPYDKKVDMFADSREAIGDEITKEGLWKVAPVDSAKTPVILIASGNANGTLDSYKQYTRANFMAIRAKLDDKYPGLAKKSYWGVIDTFAYLELITNDSILQTQYGNLVAAQLGKIFNLNDLGSSEFPPINMFGIWLYPDNRTAWYVDKDTKVAYGSTPTSGTHLKSCTIYVPNDTFAVALGSIKIYDRPNDPQKQADLWSLRQRAYVGSLGTTASNLEKAAAILRIPNV